MKKILICDDDATIREIVGMVIESEFDNELLFASCASEAVEYLKKEIDIGLVISDFNMPGGNGSVVFNYNKDAQNLPFIMLTGGYEDNFQDIENFKLNPLNTIVRKPWNENDFFDAITKILNSSDESIEEEKPEYKKVRTTIALKYFNDDVHFFEKINDIEYVQLKTEDVNSLKISINDYPYIHVYQENFKELLNAVEMRFVNYKEALNSSSLNTIFKVSEAVIDKLVMNAELIDITLVELEKLSTAVSNEIESLKKEEEIKDIIENSFLESDYFEGHSLMTMQIAFKLVINLGFANEQIIAKIIQTSILHDSLFEKEQLSEINTSLELKNAKLNEKDTKEVLDHCDKFADYFKTFNWISDDVIVAIRQHHVRRDALSLVPSGNPDDIPTFSVIFNLCHQCADHVFKYGNSIESRQKLIGILDKYYQIGNFKFAANKLVELFR